MKVFSNCAVDLLLHVLEVASPCARLRNSLPRISSQFGPHSIFSMRSPVMIETGRAVGAASLSGAVCRCS